VVVQVAARRLPLAVETVIEYVGPRSPSAAGARENGSEERVSLQIAGELARLSGGKLFTGDQRGLFPIRLILPALEQFPVLVVDDNEDSLQLVKRFAAGTRYNLACTRDTDSIFALVENIHPRIIVLDIMMPKENGWIVLGRLRQHPLTAEIPVIISTILPQEKLALSLGASAFLKKPVTRQTLLHALDQQFALLVPEYR
jgi:CheY-like chemotaxis protein